MRYAKIAKPYVFHKLRLAQQAQHRGELQVAFTHLEDAHVIGQKSTELHCLVHYLMLKHGIAQLSGKQIVGQVLRLFGALTKTCIGLLPSGNTGGTNVNPLKPMPISAQNQKIIDAIECQMKK